MLPYAPAHQCSNCIAGFIQESQNEASLKMIVHLIGPGGAGKSTTAPILAKALNVQCIDLDREYLKTSRIDLDVENLGYEYYVRKNIELYLQLTETSQDAVIATSSGFMTYAHDIHPSIAEIQRTIKESDTTVLLLPSFDPKTCVKETVSRLLLRPYESKSHEFQRSRIDKRFPIYRAIGSIQVTTNKPVSSVVSEIVHELHT